MNDRQTRVREPATYFTRIRTPVGVILLIGEDAPGGLALRGLYFANEPHAVRAIPVGAVEDARVFAEVRAQLEAYFTGARRTFELLLAPQGTAFQRDVWAALAQIPYGTTTSYAEIARAIGRPQAVRAVGAANGKNPLSIVVPCHRVVGKSGALTGYAGGLRNKERLLHLEGLKLLA